MKTYNYNFRPLVLLLVTCLFITCKKDNDNGSQISSGEIKLTVTEYGSNAPLQNVAVGLLKRTPGSGLGSASYSIVKTANTDNNGYVNFGNYTDWSQLYIDVQHPDYYDISTLGATQLAIDGYSVKLSGVSYVSLRFFNTYNKDKPENILGYYFDPYSGGGGLPPIITNNDTVYHTFLIPAFHKTNVVFSLFTNEQERLKGNPYLRSKKVPFITAPTKDTIYLTINY